MGKITSMNEANLDYNIAFCDRLVQSYKYRIPNAEFSGEDSDWLKGKLKGYVAKRKELLALKK